MKTFIFLIACHATAFAAAYGAPIQQRFHVAPHPAGNDQNDGSRESPFASVRRAQAAIRDILAKDAQTHGDLVVELAPGVYPLEQSLIFEPADSGQNGFDVVYKAAAADSVILSGGRDIQAWAPHDDGTAQTQLSIREDFRQLWVNGQRATRARTPNAGQFLTLSAEKKGNGFDLPRAGVLEGIDIRPGEVELSVLIAWMHKRLRIARLENGETSDRQRAVIEAREWDAVVNQPQGDRVYINRHYWLENSESFLDAPGEFHLDSSRGLLRYRLRPDESADKLTAVRPKLENLVLIEGTLARPVSHLRFENLTFAHTGWTGPSRHGFVDVQANSLVPVDLAAAKDEQYRHGQRKDRIPAAFQARSAHRVQIRGCRFVHLGGTGVMFTGGGTENVIEGNTFYDLSGGAIEIGEDAARPHDDRLIPRRNRITDNFVARIGEDYYGSVAILAYYTDDLTISRNEIAGLPYTAISLGWGWGNPSAPPDSRNNRITHNLVSNYMRRLDDGGGLYTTDSLPGSEISWNVVDRMLPPEADTRAGGAIYLDQHTSGVEVHHNVVTESIRWLNIWNPNIHHNRITRNFSDTHSLRNDGTDNVVEPAQLLPKERESESDEAKSIRREAGVAPKFETVRRFTARDSVVSDATQVDFALLSGDWTFAEPMDRYAGSLRSSSSPNAKARWSVPLPSATTYRISAWRPAEAGPCAYLVRHANGETRVDIVNTQNGAGWTELGRFDFLSGIQAEVEIFQLDAAKPSRIVADAVAFTR